MKKIVKSLAETQNLAKDFALSLREGDVVLLSGDLGAGKTCFTRYVLNCLGVTESITSPTFSILKTYSGKFIFHHFDFYRVNTEEAIEAGFDEVLAEPNSVKFIEWGQNVSPLIPEKHTIVNIAYLSDNEREFEIIKQ